MRFGFQSSPGRDWSSLVELFGCMDELPVFESGFVADHFNATSYDAAGRPIAAEGQYLEAWTMTAALLQATRRIRVGPLVTCVAYRNIGLLAKMVTTVDVMSGGRVEVALGAGWNEREADAFGIFLGGVRTRLDRLEESIVVLRRLLTEEVVDHEGAFWSLRGARADPKCVQRPTPPLIVGGKGQRRTVEMAVKYADCWNASIGGPESVQENADVLQRCCERYGRDRRTITLATQTWVDPHASLRELESEVRALEGAGADMVVLILLDPQHHLRSIEKVAVVLESCA